MTRDEHDQIADRLAKVDIRVHQLLAELARGLLDLERERREALARAITIEPSDE
jgi:arginine deiminase